MTSRNLFFNLVLEDWKRRLWAFALFFLAFFFAFPVILSMRMQDAVSTNFRNYLENAATFSPDMPQAQLALLKGKVVLAHLNGVNDLVMVFVLIGAVVAGISSFSYLHSRKKSDFWHCLPVRRELLFGARYVGGFLTFAITFLAGILLFFGVATAYGANVSEAIGLAFARYLIHLLYFLMLYTTSAIAAILTGNTLVSVLGTGVLLGWGPSIVNMIQTYRTTFFTTLYLWEHDSLYDWLMRRSSPAAAYFWVANSTPSWFVTDGKMFLVGSIAVVVVLIAAAMWLYKTRPVEAAGRAMAFSCTKMPIRILVVLLCALFGAMFFWEMQKAMGWAIFGAVAGGLIVHCVMEIIYEFDFRALFLHWAQAVGCVAVAAVVFFGFRYDWFGYDSWMPKAETIDHVVLDVSLDSGFLDNKIFTKEANGNIRVAINHLQDLQANEEHMKFTNLDAAFDLIRVAKEETLADRDNQLGIANVQFDTMRQETYEEQQRTIHASDKVYSYVRVAFVKKDGRVVYRSYTNFPIEKAWESYEAIHDDTSYRKGLYWKLYEESDDALVQGIYRENGTDIVLPSECLNDLREALAQDFLELTAQERTESNPVGALILTTELQKEFVQEQYSDAEDYFRSMMKEYGDSWPIYDSFERVKAILESYGISVGRKLQAENVREIYFWDNLNNEKTRSFTDKNEIAQLLGALTSGEVSDWNGLCPVFSGEVFVDSTDFPTRFSMRFEKDRMTPEVIALLEKNGMRVSIED